MPHSDKKIDREIRASLKAINSLETKSVKEFIAVVDEMRQKIVLAIAESGQLSPITQDMIKNKVNEIVRIQRLKFEKVMSDNQRRMFVKGIQLVDSAVKSGSLMNAVPFLSEKLLEQVKKFGAELITNITQDARSKIASEIDLAVMGQKPASEVIKAIGRNLKSPSVFGTIARRSELIMRTEGKRIQQLATAERLKQYGTQIKDMKKEWLHSHTGFPRLGHLELDGVVVGKDEKFKLRGEDGKTYLINAPYDPILPAGETINCRCSVIPVIGRFQKMKVRPPIIPFRSVNILDEDMITLGKVRGSLTVETKRKLTEAKKEILRGTTTREVHTIEGVYSQSRAKIHREITDELFSNVTPSNQPQIIMTGGIPGSGKSKAIKKLSLDNFVKIDSDEIKKMLPEYNGNNAALLQTEADDIISDAMARAVKERKSIFFDGTMKSVEKYDRLVDMFTSQGYGTTAVFIESPMELAMIRAVARFEKTGRYVDLEYIASHDKLNLKTFNKLKQKLTHWKHYDNSSSGLVLTDSK